MGFASIINLRLDSERGTDIDAEAAAAKAAGINFGHLLLSGSMPDPAVADRFLKIITEPGNQPAFIHCASPVKQKVSLRGLSLAQPVLDNPMAGILPVKWEDQLAGTCDEA